MKKILIILAAVIIIAAVVWRNTSRDTTKIISVQMEEIQRMTIEQVVSATGNIQPVSEVKLSANVSSEIIELKVEEGEQVEVGEVLVVLDSLKYSAYVAQARSALLASQAGYEQVKSEFDRAVQLFENNLISHQELEALEANYTLSESNVEQSRARLEQSIDDLQKTVLKSPLNGTVTSIQKEAGEMALGSVFQADVILVISDLTSMEVIVDIDETDVVDIDLGNEVEIEVDALPDISLSGNVSQIAISSKSSQGMLMQEDIVYYEVRIRIDMTSMVQGVLPGMSATSNITTRISENAVAIPIQSLTARPVTKEDNESKDEEISLYTQESKDMEDVVFIAMADTVKKTGLKFGKKESTYIVEKRPVIIGISSNNFYELLSGANEGDLIITGNYKAINKELKDGSKVKKKARKSFRGKKKKDE